MNNQVITKELISKTIVKRYSIYTKYINQQLDRHFHDISIKKRDTLIDKIHNELFNTIVSKYYGKKEDKFTINKIIADELKEITKKVLDINAKSDFGIKHNKEAFINNIAFISSLDITYDLGHASHELIADILSDISILYRTQGGSGISFEAMNVLQPAGTLV